MVDASSIVVRLPAAPAERFISVPTLDDLREINSAGLDDGQNVFVEGGETAGDARGGIYVWNSASTKNDREPTVIRPDDLEPLEAGRWLLVAGNKSLIGFSVDDYLTPDDDDPDVVAENTLGLVRLAADINAAGGGIVDFSPGSTYWVAGAQNQPRTASPIYVSYTRGPIHYYLLWLKDCETVILRGNGATIKNAAGGYYGSFEADDTPAVSPGYKLASPYYAMIYGDNVDGLEVIDLTLDGNTPNTNIGSDGGGDIDIQIPKSGISLHNCRRVKLEGVTSHWHGLDGIHIEGDANSEDDGYEISTVTRCKFEFNGRQGCSFVGGRGWLFDLCSFSYQGMASKTGDAAGPVRSNPCSGLDFEPDGGRLARDIEVSRSQCINNTNTATVADSGTKAGRIRFNRCLFVACRAGSKTAYITRPGFEFEGCIFAGTAYLTHQGYGIAADPFVPQTATLLRRCTFTDDVSFSPTGSLSMDNYFLVLGSGAYLSYEKCTFIGTQALTRFDNLDGPICTDCTFVARGSCQFDAGARLRGTQTHFVEEDTALVSIPNYNNSISGKNIAGHAEDSWLYTTTKTTITAFGSGTGGAGTYTVSNTHTRDSAAVTVTSSTGLVKARITASFSGTTMTVTSLDEGSAIGVGDKLTLTSRYSRTLDGATGQPVGYASYGDVDLTLTPATSKRLIVFAAPLTALRTLTLATNGARQGMRYRIVRTAAATGAFNLSVGGLKNLAVSQWAEVEWTGSTWFIAASGSL